MVSSQHLCSRWSSPVINTSDDIITDSNGFFAGYGTGNRNCKKNNSAMPLGELAEALYGSSIQEHPDFATQDFSCVYKYLRSRTQVVNQ